MPCFVVLHHETPEGHPRGPHYDLMLEFDGALRTWALAELPSVGRIVVAERLPDHRLAYLDYEGEVAGGRGRVSRIDAGQYDLLEDRATELIVTLRGSRLQGKLTFTSLRDDSGCWRIWLSADD